MSYTPGPWDAEDSTYGCAVRDPSGMTVAWCGIHVSVGVDGARKIHKSQTTKNARLIAAAPDLLAALKCLIADLGDALDGMPAIAMARAAIAKASGAE